jgi:hypothetical protein
VLRPESEFAIFRLDPQCRPYPEIESDIRSFTAFASTVGCASDGRHRFLKREALLVQGAANDGTNDTASFRA